jgi:hypothetical protein
MSEKKLAEQKGLCRVMPSSTGSTPTRSILIGRPEASPAGFASRFLSPEPA